MKRVYAKFIGKDSLGYKSNKSYIIFVQVSMHGNLFIERADGTGICPYANTVTFLDNWTDIRTV